MKERTTLRTHYEKQDTRRERECERHLLKHILHLLTALKDCLQDINDPSSLSLTHTLTYNICHLC